MLKFTGACLIIISAAGIGASFSVDLKKRCRELRILKQMVYMLRGEIKYTKSPLPEAFYHISVRLPRPFGPFLAASLADVILDKVFLSADSFDPELGFLAEFEMTAFAKVEFMRHARKCVVLMDSSKVSRGLSAMRFARPEEVDVVVMDADPDGVVRASCNAGEKNVEIIEAVDA